MSNTKKLKIDKSSGNIFADLEFIDAKRYQAKVELARQINKIIADRKLKQIEAAEILGIDQPKVSALSCGRLDSFSIERLILFLNRLDRDIIIVVGKKSVRRKTHGHLKVAFA